MSKRVSVSEARARLLEFLTRVGQDGERYIIELKGKPAAALTGVQELERIEAEGATAAQPLGALALVGAWGDVEDVEVDAVIAEIYSRRVRDAGMEVGREDPRGALDEG